MSLLVIKSALPWWVTILMVLYSSNVYKGNTDGSWVTKRGASASYGSTVSWRYITHLATSIKMYLDLSETSCTNWRNVMLYQQRMLERNCQMRRYHFLIPACLPSKLLNTCGFFGTRKHPTLSPASLPSYLGMLYTVSSGRQLPQAAFPGALWGELQVDLKGVKFEQVHQHRARVAIPSSVGYLSNFFVSQWPIAKTCATSSRLWPWWIHFCSILILSSLCKSHCG